MIADQANIFLDVDNWDYMISVIETPSPPPQDWLGPYFSLFTNQLFEIGQIHIHYYRI